MPRELASTIRYVEECLAEHRKNPHWSLKRIAAELGIGHMTVKRAFDYARRIDREGVTDPYRELHGPPERASRWRSRQRTS